MDEFRKNKGVVETYGWMGWLYTIVGCFIVALLVLMFLDMSNHSRHYQEDFPVVQTATTPIEGPINTL